MHRSLYHDDQETLECFTCRRECDPEAETMTTLDGYPQCEECREICDGGCGEWITDETIAVLGPMVCFRDYVMDGRLTRSHAQCAATTLMTYRDEDFNYDHTSREAIAEMVQPRRLAVVCR